MYLLRDETGVSLLEVMTAMFLVALISSCLLGGLAVSGQMIRRAGQESQASNFAFRILEDLRSRPAEELADMSSIIIDEGELSFVANGAEEYNGNLQATVSLDERQDLPGLYDAKVTVTWQEAGHSRALEMSTYIYPSLRGAL